MKCALWAACACLSYNLFVEVLCISVTSGPFLMEVYSAGSMYMSVVVADELSMVGVVYWCTGFPVRVVGRPDGS